MAKKVMKIVITGPFASGKTTFVKSLSEVVPLETDVALSSIGERLIKTYTTVALDYGKIRVSDDLVVHLFGTPGQFRFKFMWKILARGMHGYILLVDGSRPEAIPEAIQVYEYFRGMGDVPHIIAVNKQDIPGSLGPEDVRRLMGVEDDVPVISLVAKDPESVKNALITLVGHMISVMERKEHVVAESRRRRWLFFRR